MQEQRHNISKLSNELAEDGIIIIDDFLSADECDRLRTEIERKLENDEFNRDDDASYTELTERNEATLKRRSGDVDEGMIDIFHVDRSISDFEDIKHDEFIADIINKAANKKYTPDNTNIYANESVTDTRGYHADTYAGKYKSFIYLTDVPDKSYGPFSYIKGSHQRSALKRRVNIIINKIKGNPETDAAFYDEKDEVICTAPKGTLIIANQAGNHRGQPQEQGKERMVTTTSYTPEET